MKDKKQIKTKGYIYKLELLKNVGRFKKGEVYIGQHCGNKPSYYTGGILPKRLIKKFGKNIFKREIIHKEIELEKLDYWEEFYISEYNSQRNCKECKEVHMNLTPGGQLSNVDVVGKNNPNYGNTWSEESKLKMSERRKSELTQKKYKDILMNNSKKGVEARNELLKDVKYKKKFKQSVSEGKTKYNILKHDTDNNLLKIYYFNDELEEDHPTFSRPHIWRACKHRTGFYKGFIWKLENK